MATANFGAAAARVGGALLKAAPGVQQKALELLERTTGNRVNSSTPIAAVTEFAKSNTGRFAITAEAMVRAGISPDDLLPEDLVGGDRELARVRATLMTIVGAAQERFQAGAANSPTLTTSVDIARGALIMKQVQAVLRVFGTKENYFLCIPNGGVPVESFAFYETMTRAQRG